MILDIGQNSKFQVKEKHFLLTFLSIWEDNFWWVQMENFTHLVFHPPLFSSFTKQNNGKLPFYIIISPSSPFSAQLIIPQDNHQQKFD